MSTSKPTLLNATAPAFNPAHKYTNSWPYHEFQPADAQPYLADSWPHQEFHPVQPYQEIYPVDVQPNHDFHLASPVQPEYFIDSQDAQPYQEFRPAHPLQPDYHTHPQDPFANQLKEVDTLWSAYEPVTGGYYAMSGEFFPDRVYGSYDSVTSGDVSGGWKGKKGWKKGWKAAKKEGMKEEGEGKKKEGQGMGEAEKSGKKKNKKSKKKKNAANVNANVHKQDVAKTEERKMDKVDKQIDDAREDSGAEMVGAP